MSLTKEERAKLPADHFAVPGKRKLPIHDAAHVRLAWDMVERTQDLSHEERTAARQRIIRRAHELGVDTQDWHAQAVITFEAMAIEMPDVEGHPNRKPFKGILTRVDEPSDEPPGGALGKCVMLPTTVAEEALDSLGGMAVDCDPDGKFDSHDPKHKIGIITGATIEGSALEIEGFFYANDFPELWKRIQAEKHLLGFSYECKVRIRDLNADIWVADWCLFTGAALLYKKDAAYHTTELAAAAAEENQMSKEILDAIAALSSGFEKVTKTVEGVVADVKTLKAGKGSSLAGPIVDQVEPHVAACHAAADAMEAKGIGAHPTMGHASMLRRVAGHMLQCAVAGHMPHIYRDHDYLYSSAERKDPQAEAALQAAQTKNAELEKQLKAMQDALAGLTTQIADLKAAGAKKVDEPVRKTQSAETTALLNKFNLKAEEGKALSVESVDKALEAAGVKGTAAMAAKLKLRSEGLLN